MTSINPHYTFQYSQPDEYHFSHDSVFLARKVFEEIRNENITQYEVLDLCAGCGIVGLDFLFHCNKELNLFPKRCDFVEVQEVYEDYFKKNASNISKNICHFLNMNYSKLTQENRKYDLILCNPPYFNLGQGALSPSTFKNRCRFFIDSDFNTLLTTIKQTMWSLFKQNFLTAYELP